ncbi:hypothetical protein L9F63_025941 [Diploptera punctata]|uniref:Uncharacterized protein n=1 Tax=Diploptera punctata TaxID=6984 RepID=A0AAD7Z630_DIPPU|nr:hypothetical protein L9F63_025941 [Diploptera punctata]
MVVEEILRKKSVALNTARREDRHHNHGTRSKDSGISLHLQHGFFHSLLSLGTYHTQYISSSHKNVLESETTTHSPRMSHGSSLWDPRLSANRGCENSLC